MKTVLFGSLILCSAFVASFSAGLLRGPLHAQCKVTWTWPSTDCTVPLAGLVDQINKWTSEDNCKDGGEKCLYTQKDHSSSMIKATHETPVKHYVDDLTFTVTKNDGTCQIQVIITILIK